jgi:hypothetical protein
MLLPAHECKKFKKLIKLKKLKKNQTVKKNQLKFKKKTNQFGFDFISLKPKKPNRKNQKKPSQTDQN